MPSVFRGRAQKDVFGVIVFEEKKIYETTSDVPEIKLFKLFIIGLKKNYNGEAALCWSHFISFSWDATPLQHILTYLHFLVLV